MKKQKCDICGREVIPSLTINAVRHRKRKKIFSTGFKIVSSPYKMYICSKCEATVKTMIRCNIAVKTSDIIGE